jgi:hypothetical protein
MKARGSDFPSNLGKSIFWNHGGVVVVAEASAAEAVGVVKFSGEVVADEDHWL